MVRAFYHGEDLHQHTADAVAPLKGNRAAGKMCNFALVYYATATRMHYEYPEYSIREWSDIISLYFEEYWGVRAWHLRSDTLLNSTGVCTEIFGRKRRFLKSQIYKNPKHALNSFINFGPQSSACHMIEYALGNLRRKWIADGIWMDQVTISNMVHDEIVVEANPEIVPSVYADVRDALELSVQLKVPVRAALYVVDRWSDAK